MLLAKENQPLIDALNTGLDAIIADDCASCVRRAGPSSRLRSRSSKGSA